LPQYTIAVEEELEQLLDEQDEEDEDEL